MDCPPDRMAVVPISTERLRKLEDIVRLCETPTGNADQDFVNQMMLSVLSSPNGSDIQEQLLVEACNASHKGGKKHGADGTSSDDGTELEAKPNKVAKTASSVNITDDTPTRLMKDMRMPNKRVAIGRCPGGKRFRWVVVCPMMDFAESRYLAMCKHWGQPAQAWPSALDDQLRLVQSLVDVQGKNKYLRSSQLKFKDIRTPLGFWIHPDEDVTKLKGKSAEEDLMRRFSGK